jgi:hypothetical protein
MREDDEGQSLALELMHSLSMGLLVSLGLLVLHWSGLSRSEQDHFISGW